MRTWLRWITGLAGLSIVGIGLVATWRVLTPADGGSGFPGTTLDGWMFEGPALITFGLLLTWIVIGNREGAAGLEERGPRLLVQIGLGFLALPAATWGWNEAAGTATSAYVWIFAAFTFGVPGVALTLTGAAIWSWRRLRREPR